MKNIYPVTQNERHTANNTCVNCLIVIPYGLSMIKSLKLQLCYWLLHIKKRLHHSWFLTKGFCASYLATPRNIYHTPKLKILGSNCQRMENCDYCDPCLQNDFDNDNSIKKWFLISTSPNLTGLAHILCELFSINKSCPESQNIGLK